MTPMPQGTRDRLRERFLDTKGHWVPEGPKGQAPMGELPRRPYVRSDERAIGYVPYEKGELPDPLPATLVAFYLPQFHTIPENDEWWGKGFTEWRNVTRALPQFEGHYQPKLPGDLGFYDLRNVEVMHEQARLAREYGISAFCFYFYWFGGKTLLETPLRNWLNDKTIDLKFCLCWANEKWTRTWDGRGDEILIDQKHSPEDDIAFIEYVAEYMRDPRYLRVDGKPVLLVYRPGLLPNVAATMLQWREWCIENGIGHVHLVYVQSFDRAPPEELGFDAATQFPPNFFNSPDISGRQYLINPDYRGSVLEWHGLQKAANEAVGENIYRCVSPGWDNEARRPGRGRAFIHATPTTYQRWLELAIRCSVTTSSASPITFINAWNEWAEGAFLEPSARHGYALLSATRNALFGVTRDERGWAHTVVHAWHLDILEQMLPQLRVVASLMDITFTTTADKAEAVKRLASSLPCTNRIEIFENRGRDILPFIAVANRLAHEGIRWVLKLHTKKSPHLASGDTWRHELLLSIVPQDITGLLEKLRFDESTGIVAPTGHLLPVADYVGANSHWLKRIGEGSRINYEDSTALFPAGSMYWCRLSAISDLLETDLFASDFEQEEGQIDGTLAHALERVVGIQADSAGFAVLSIAQFMHGRDDGTAFHYPYAAKASGKIT
nr:glycoside hydrolase family 99-like domain-containing protein [Pseudoxanthomonas sp. LH2527]